MPYRVHEAALVERLSRGDLAALAELFDDYAGHALLVARRLTTDEGKAELAVEQGFLDVWREARSGESDVYAQLLRAVHRRARPLVTS